MPNKIWQFQRLEEIETATENKVWLINKISGETALFKTDYNCMKIPENQAEVNVYQIALQLGISSAITESININDIDWEGFDVIAAGFEYPTGTISYNFKTDKNVIYKTADRAFGKIGGVSGKVTFESRNNSSLSDMDYKTLLQKFPDIKEDIINMAYLDCLVNNSDRHGENWELICDPKTSKILKIAPLFDHAIALQNGYSDNLSRIYWELPPKKYQDKLQSHFEVFQNFCKHHFESIKVLLNKTEESAENNKLDGFTISRFKEMKEIYQLQKGCLLL